MKLDGAFTVPVPRATVWDAIRDPGLMARCVPGCVLAEQIDETRYRAIVAVKFGPIAARFNLVIEIEDQSELEFMRARARGEEGTRASVVSSESLLTLTETGPDLTDVTWSADVQISGRLGRYGLGLMCKKVESLSAELVENFAAWLEPGAAREGA